MLVMLKQHQQKHHKSEVLTMVSYGIYTYLGSSNGDG